MTLHQPGQLKTRAQSRPALNMRGRNTASACLSAVHVRFLIQLALQPGLIGC